MSSRPYHQRHEYKDRSKYFSRDRRRDDRYPRDSRNDRYSKNYAAHTTGNLHTLITGTTAASVMLPNPKYPKDFSSYNGSICNNKSKSTG